MEPNRREFIKQCAFQKFCNTVLHNEACDAHKELHRHKAREITFSDLTLEEARQLHTFDEYFKGEIAFERAGKKITPKLLLEAIRTLPEEKRKAVLLYYFEGMNDTEIAELFDTSRSTIQYRRTSSFELLKKYLEEKEIGTIIHYPIPPHLSEAYQYLGYKKGDFPITEQYASQVLSLPMYNGMTEEEQSYVIDAINAF